MGKLQGISLTPELRSIIGTVLALQPSQTKGENEIKEASVANPSAYVTSSSSSPRSMSSSSPDALLEQVQQAKRDISRPSCTSEEAKSLLEVGNGDTLPLVGVQALKHLIINSQSDAESKAQLLQRLESSLHQTTLSFAPKPTKTVDPQYQKRLERLRLQDEERSYMNLTTNLKNASSLKDDNVTAKSMMYATSVGLNMVVAPLSFGVFMYFFAGSIFSRFFDEEGSRGDNIDIRRVIAGVVSGVFMLFVEMILFVIRSHELDASVRKKSRRRENRANPFGYTQKAMERVYNEDD